MLNTYIHLGSSESSSFELSDYGVWVCVDSGFDISALNERIQNGLECGLSLFETLKAGLGVLDEFQRDGANILLCRFDSFHYELCWIGEMGAALLHGDEGVLPLISESSHKVERIIGDLHTDEILVFGNSLLLPNVSKIGDALDLMLSESPNSVEGAVKNIARSSDYNQCLDGAVFIHYPLNEPSSLLKDLPQLRARRRVRNKLLAITKPVLALVLVGSLLGWLLTSQVALS
ncbi:hypothetical protein A3762_13230 [Oleiphilus sp. HI0125]|uniref:hypothetical protein n=1 Tax=Oleiphilus sp. HI0125 TaxID=1822266 RepID=UPI0007C2844A|nr:hypothetical protein [Oleiphilus sp. HI0125]KZZ61774.1 hypothetical protein A3762_24160 [Oleiphilus sp. HI0125]KZZ62646.1 hypothetical protein A3762_13230 [Oleiphilus sp. HI0125]